MSHAGIGLKTSCLTRPAPGDRRRHRNSWEICLEMPIRQKMMAMPWEVMVEKDAAAMARRSADLFLDMARESTKERGCFAVAISGGNTPRPLHRLLAEKSDDLEEVWGKTHLFWVDERCVPAEDPASNYGMARQDFIWRIPIPTSQVHPVNGILPPEQGARDYEAILKSFFQVKGCAFPRFDLVVLGVGSDGHTASLFPHHHALGERERWVVAVKGGYPDMWRVTLTLPVLNASRQVLFLVSGEGKRDIVEKIFESGGEALPVRFIQPGAGSTTWIMDEDAAMGVCTQTM